jgi:NAD(P)H-dependent FMN reductase
MNPACSILIFAGSTRQNSYNKKLVKIAGQAAQSAGASVTFIDLKDFPLPLYDEDLEASEGIPPQALRLKALLLSHQGFLIACPEYNSSISGVLKNAIDWASRPMEGEVPMACFKGKVCALMSASPGALGGLRGLVPVRSLLENIGVWVLPDQVAISKAHEAFTEGGQLQDARQQSSIEALGVNLARILQKLNA